MALIWINTSWMSVHHQNPAWSTATSRGFPSICVYPIEEKRVSIHQGYIYRRVPSGRPPNTWTYSNTHPCPFLLLKQQTWHFPNGLQCAGFFFSSDQNCFIPIFADGVKVPVSKARWNLKLVNDSRGAGSLEVSLVWSSYDISATRQLNAGQPSNPQAMLNPRI